jgi:hypothetical protein
MSPETLFRIHLLLGYVAWLRCFSSYIWPRLRAMDRVDAHRAIATLHSFRLYGLVLVRKPLQDIRMFLTAILFHCRGGRRPRWANDQDSFWQGAR